VNTAHEEIDIALPKENAKISGFLPVERAWLDKLAAHGYIDTFRHFPQGTRPIYLVGYENRSQGAKCRLENRLFFVTENLLSKVDKALIMQR